MQAESTKQEVTRTDEGVEYVVQKSLDAGPAAPPEWRDIAKVTVPKRSQVRTILTAAVKQAHLIPDLTDRFRVLDPGAARELLLKPKVQPQPEYEAVIVTDGQLHEVPDAPA